MTNLDSIFKSRDVILPTKVCLVKAMVFPVVMYGCVSWSIKEAEHQRIDAFELWCWRRLESHSDCTLRPASAALGWEALLRGLWLLSEGLYVLHVTQPF